MKPSDHSPKLIMLIGLPASGKTTWTNKFLAQNPGYTVVSSDDIIERYAKKDGINYSQAFHKYADVADKEFKQELQAALQAKKNIIVDRTNMSKKSRNKILSNVPKGYERIAVVFDVARPELDKRLVQREYDTGKRIPKEVVDGMHASYSPPSKEEGFAEIIQG